MNIRKQIIVSLEMSIVLMMVMFFSQRTETLVTNAQTEKPDTDIIYDICVLGVTHGDENFFPVTGRISDVYCAYGNTSTSNKLGVPVSDEIACTDSDNCIEYKQEFAHGTIYFNPNEDNAFALFNNMDVAYKNNWRTLGHPISSEIGNAGEGICLALFENGYLKCTGGSYTVGQPVLWNNMKPSEIYEIIHDSSPGTILNEGLLMPFHKTFTNAEFSGGLHAWGHEVDGEYHKGQGSAFDISGTQMNVLAMASGRVIDVNRVNDCKTQGPATGLGCWVAVRNDFSSTVIVYGHIQPAVNVGDYVYQGKLIGNTGNCLNSAGVVDTDYCIGHSEGPHVHIEFRMGFSYQPESDLISNSQPDQSFYRNAEDVSQTRWGEVLDWNGWEVDNYKIHGLFTTQAGYKGLDYDGTATELGYSTVLTNFTFIESTGLPKNAWGTLTTSAWATCRNSYKDALDRYVCDRYPNGPFVYDGTTFTLGGVDSINLSSDSNNSLLQNKILAGDGFSYPYLISSNEYNFATRVIVQPPISDDPECATVTDAGIYFYGNTNYQSPCYFTPHDVADFANTPLGDNGVQSVRMVGGYGLKLYRDTNQDGPYTVIPGDDANLNDNSYGGNYSSAEVVDQRGNCPTDGSAGVYLYSNRGFDGRCTFTVTDIPDLGANGIYVGNDDLSSIRFIGSWEATIYEDRDYGDRYDVIGSDDPNLDIRSLGGQYSSIKIVSVETGIQEEILISHLPPNPQRNGGFEENLTWWSSSGGSFDIATDEPNTGSSYVKGTSAEEAYLYQDVDIRQYSEQISTGLIGANLQVWLHNGNSEEYKIKIVFLNSNRQFISDNSSEWSQHDGGYQDKSRHQEVLPANTAFIRVELHARRFSGDYTDVDFDDVTLKLLISEEEISPLQPCEIFEYDGVVLFDDAQCEETNPALSYDDETTLINLSTVNFDNRTSSIHVAEGWSVMVYEQSQGAGARRCINGQMWNLAVDQYNNTTINLNNSISSIEVFPNNTCNDGIVVSQPLTFQQPLYSGQLITARFALRNVNNYPVTLGWVGLEVRGPYCQTYDCPNKSGFPAVENVTIPAGGEYVYETHRLFEHVSDGYIFWPISRDANNIWRSHGPQTQIPVIAGLGVASQVIFQPAKPVVGRNVTATFTIQNYTTQTMTIPHLGLLARGPNCSSWECTDGWADFPVVHNITLAPGQTYTYEQTRLFYEPGPDYFADIIIGDHNTWWYSFPGNVRKYFEVERGLEMTQPVAFTPSNLVAGEPVRATFTIQNFSSQSIPLDRLLLGVHGPNCQDWDCPRVVDFAHVRNLTLQPGEAYTYDATRIFNEVGPDYLFLPHTQDYNNNWRSYGEMIRKEVNPGIEIVTPLSLHPANPNANELVTAQYTIRNAGNRLITIEGLSVIARGPNCNDWVCEGKNVDFPKVQNITLAPGEIYTYSQSRLFGTAGDGYFADAALEDTNHWWYTIPGNERVSYAVQSSNDPPPAPGELELLEAMQLSPPSPVAGEMVRGTFTLINNSASPIALDSIVLGVHGPSCATWDCQNVSDFPIVRNVVLQPGETFSYDEARAFYVPNTDYLVQVHTKDIYGNWHAYGTQERIAVGQGLTITEQVSLSPSAPVAGEDVTARFTVKNQGNRPITLNHLTVIARGPNCITWDCSDRNLDFPWVTNLTLDPQETYTYVQTRQISTSGSQFIADAAFEDTNQWWYTVPGNQRLTFSVSPQNSGIPGMTINMGDLYTNDDQVSIQVTGPNIAQVRLSNDGAYINQGWQPYQSTIPWTITTYGDYAMPRLVYAWIMDQEGNIQGPLIDDIVYDPTPPTGSVMISANSSSSLLTIVGEDNLSGVQSMRLSANSDLSSSTGWIPFVTEYEWHIPESDVYMQLVDQAGNVSAIIKGVLAGNPPQGDEQRVYLPLIIKPD